MEKNSHLLKDSSFNAGSHDVLRKLLELEEEKRAIFEKSGDAIFIVHAVCGEILEANGKAEAMTGYPASELQGMNFKELIREPNVWPKTIEFHQLNGNGGLSAVLKRQDGSSLGVDISAGSIYRDDKSVRLIFVNKPGSGDLSGSNSGDSSNGAKDDREPVYEFPTIIGRSEKTRTICQLIGKVAKTECTVLIQGDSGTGKEIVAQAIHFHSSRSKGPFVKVNCAALSETLLESELFGHVKGSFTGAIRDHTGRFMQANGGTIFLDEVSCMSLSGQAKLLRVLEEREFEPVGSSITTKIDVRVIAASNANLENAVAEGHFREDLFYRLNVFTMLLPTLREKIEDIPLLAKHFLRKYSLAIGKDIRSFASETLTLMMHYEWPGNVRELENAVEHAVIVGKGPVIYPSDLPSKLTLHGKLQENQDFPKELSLRDQLNLFEKQIIQNALRRANGVKKKAAAMLHIDPRNFPYLLRKHNLNEKS